MVDVNAQITAVDRAVRTEDVDGASSRVQTLAQIYPSPLADVWDAVTSPDRIARWFLPVEGEARLGGRYQVVGNAGGEVLECAPPHDGRAAYRITWEYGGGMSWVDIELTSAGDESTTLQLRHTARVDDLPPGFWETYGPGATGVGWDSGLLGLSLHLGSATDGPTPAEAEAWMLSDEGKQFARGAADGWAAAQVADGGDPEAAASAADATFRFYTGQVAEAAPEA